MVFVAAQCRTKPKEMDVVVNLLVLLFTDVGLVSQLVVFAYTSCWKLASTSTVCFSLVVFDCLCGIRKVMVETFAAGFLDFGKKLVVKGEQEGENEENKLRFLF